MKKKIFLLMISMLLIGVNVYAAGDLIVNGQLAVGSDAPIGKLRVVSDNEKGIRVDAGFSSPSSAVNIGAFYSVTADQTNIVDKGFIGFQGQVGLAGYGTDIDLIGTENIVVLNSTTSSTIAHAKGNTAIFRVGTLNTANHTVTNYYGFHSYGGNGRSQIVNGTDWRHAYYEDFINNNGTIANTSGLWIDKQTQGTKNYGIVLNGDGAGADIVFGTSQGSRIYSTGGVLYASDNAFNTTQISPHDPETGEWIYYSKNIKTGRTVRVNMEKLIKAVEMLTGETFMVETLIEDK